MAIESKSPEYIAFFFFACAFVAQVQASTLDTPSFTVTIESRCEEGSVSCDNVSYRGVSKKTGSAITLKGRTIHTRCKDGSPCRFLGYEFRSGRTVYRVWEEGRLEVSQGDKVLVDEPGHWDW